MKIQVLIYLAAVVLIGLTISCERIPPPEKAFSLVETQLINQESIPMEYGKLISVTSAKPGIAHLWFEDANHTIRMVQINYGKGVVNKDIKIINRK